MQIEFWKNIGQASPDSETCETAAPTTWNPLTSLPEGSPASPSAAPAPAEALRILGGSGQSSTESFASLDPGGCWRKMYHRYYRLTLDGSLEEYSGTWPRAILMCRRIVYRRPPLAPITAATGYGLWPTPTVHGNHNRAGSASKSGDGLATAVKRWPTPRASERSQRNSRDGGMALSRAVRLWPPPTARDAKSRGPSEADRNSPSLNHVATGGRGGQLNPTWEEWLMGFPMGWTVVE